MNETKNTLLIFEDPQNGFASPDGTFGRTYGPEQLLSIQQPLYRAQEFINEVAYSIHIMYLRSEYKEGQFVEGPESPLFNLCVPGKNKDCDWYNGINPPPNAQVLTKHQNNALETPEVLKEITALVKNGVDRIVIAGCTVTHCIRQTALALQEAFGDKVEIIVPLNLVGARMSYYEPTEEGPNKILKILEELRAAGITVTINHQEVLDEKTL